MNMNMSDELKELIKKEPNLYFKVAVRIRPFLTYEFGVERCIVNHPKDHQMVIVEDKPFVFDNIYNEHVSQGHLYTSLLYPMVSHLLEGYHCTVMAYGHTGTGKTYTMGSNLKKGCHIRLDDSAGLLTRALEDIFIRVPLKAEEYTISISSTEVYNDKVYDLLSRQTDIPLKANRMNSATWHAVRTREKALEIFQKGTMSRHTRGTKMNPESSRSHALFSIRVKMKSNTGRNTNSCLHLVDLAGTEGVRETGHEGAALQEGSKINQSLLGLHLLLKNLSSKNAKFETCYRESTLTTLLQDALNSQNYVTLLGCISPNSVQIKNTLTTLAFVAGAKLVRSKPQIQTIYNELKEISDRKKRELVLETPKNTSKSTEFLKPQTPKEKTARGNYLNRPSPYLSSVKRVNKFNANSKFGVGSTPSSSKPRVISHVSTPISSLSVNRFGGNTRKSPQSLIKPTQVYRQALQNKQENNYLLKSPHMQIQIVPVGESPRTPEHPMLPVIMENENNDNVFYSIFDQDHAASSTRASTATFTDNKKSYTPQLEQIKMRLDQLQSRFDTTFDLTGISTFNTINKENTISKNNTTVYTEETLPFNVYDETRPNETVPSEGYNESNSTNMASSRLTVRSRPQRTRTSVKKCKASCCSSPAKTIGMCDEHKVLEKQSCVSDFPSMGDVIKNTNKKAPVLSTYDGTSFVINVRMDTKGNPIILNAMPSSDSSSLSSVSQDKSNRKSNLLEAKTQYQVLRKLVLHVLNTSNPKDLQVLATVGPVTAQLLYNYRIKNGRFKSLKQLKDLPFWKEKSYQNFLTSNHL